MNTEGRTSEQNVAVFTRLRAGNPVTWLMDQVESLDLPTDLKAHIDQLFRGHEKYLGVDPDTAREDAYRIGCRINWARAQWELMRTDPTNPRYFTLSKVASLWATNDLKFKSRLKKDTPAGNRKKQVPRASVRSTLDDEDDDSAEGAA